MPFVEDAAIVDGPKATATKTPLPKLTPPQKDAEGNVLAVHVMPSGDVAAVVEAFAATATKTPLP